MEVNLNKQRFLDSEIHSVLDEYEWISDDLLAVGGCVRDFIINRDYDDIDIASSTLPETVIKRAEDRGFKVYETGVEHGTVTLQSMRTNELIEHTTFRKDVSTDGRRATVEFSDTFREDSARRDFTINALGININGKIFDFHNGVKDLETEILDFVGETEDRLAEDALRALRAFRFACRFGLEIQPDDLYLIQKTFMEDFNDIVSTERVFMEIEKAIKQMPSSNEWFRFITYFSFYVAPYVFNVNTDGYSLRRKISHPCVLNSASYDAFIHMLLWDTEGTDNLPLTIPQKRRMKFSRDLIQNEVWESVWNYRNIVQQTDTFQTDWFIEFLGFDYEDVVNTLEEVLDEDWPEHLEGPEIGLWQKELFKVRVNRLGR